MFSIPHAVSILIVTLVLTACGTIQAGRDFDVRSFEMNVERGVTTQNQIRTWLGTPANTGVNVDTGGERFDEWTYYFAAGRLPDMSNSRMKMLQIKFDKQGIVRGYNWSMSDQ